MKPISVLASPRSGSNLLVDSLATHPDAKSSGEWYNPRRGPRNTLNKEKGAEYCNLFKFFGDHTGRKEFKEITERSYKVMLFRVDVEAQLRSWKKACKTGRWIAEGDCGPAMPFPNNARHLIENGHRLFRPMADFYISYEDLIRNWDEVTKAILERAGWSAAPIAKMRERLPS